MGAFVLLWKPQFPHEKHAGEATLLRHPYFLSSEYFPGPVALSRSKPPRMLTFL